MKTPTLSLKKGSLDAAQRLAALESWTAEPAQAVAERIGAAAVEEQKPEEVAPAARVTKRSGKSPAAHEPAAGGDGEGLPWVGATGSHMTTYRIPTRIYLKLKWLGETTYGSSATKILCDVMEPAIDKMLKDRGIEP